MAQKSLEQVEKMAQRALDMLEVQNIFSRHEYYHSAGMHREELEAIWAKKTPGVSFEAEGARKFVGWEAVWKFYVDDNAMRRKNHLEQMRKLFPEIEDKPENDRIGGRGMHTLTTPVIEVAEDGKTAKGVWVSPGYLTGLRDGKLQANWFWERYGVDFVKEDGEWKIWHCRVYTDFMTPYEKSWVESSMEPRRAAQPTPGISQPNAPSSQIYEAYSPFTVPQYEPRPPEPYKTFDETFSY